MPWDDRTVQDVFDIAGELKQSLFGGTSVTAGGTFKDECERYGGHVPGTGPECTGGDSDLVGWKLAECYYKAAYTCIRAYAAASAQNCAEEMIYRAGHGVSSGLQRFTDRETQLVQIRLDCYGKIEDKCACKRCNFISHNLPPPADEDTPADNSPLPPEGDPDTDGNQADPTLTTIKTASQFSSIPVIFGEYVVGGNLIWVDEQKTETFSYYKSTADGQKLGPFTEPVQSIGFMLGLAEGELNNVLRVWFGDAVVYNQTISVDGAMPTFTPGNDGATDLDLAMLADGTYTLDRLAATKPQLAWFNGSPHQKVNPDYAKTVGFGKAPAHRDLAYIYFSNINLNFFAAGDFPEIKVDVVSNEPSDSFDALAGDVSGRSDDYLEVDLRTQEVIMRTSTQIKMLNLNTLDATYTADLPASTQAVVKMPSSELLAVTDDTVFVLDPYSGDTLASIPYTGGAVDDNCVSLVYHDLYIDPDSIDADGDLFPHDFTFLSSADGSAQCIDYDYTRAQIDSTLSVAATSGYTLGYAAITAIDGDPYYLQLLIPSGTQDHILRKAFKITDAGVLVNSLDSVDISLVGNALYGSETAGISIEQAFIDGTDNSFVLFVKTPTRSVIAKVQMDGTVTWSVDSPYAFPATFSQGERRSLAPTTDYAWITPTGQVAAVTLNDGTVTLKTTLADQGWPALDGSQYFEGRTRTIVYVTADGVARLFLDKLSPNAISLADVFERMGTLSGLPLGTINADEIAEVTIKGLQLQDNDTLRGLAEVLGPFYQFAMIDDGTRIFFTREASQSDVIDIADQDYIEDSLTVSKELLVTQNLTAAVKFVTITDLGLIDTTQTASLRPDDGQVFEDDGLNYQFQINDDPAHMRQYLEKALAIQHDMQKSLQVDLPPKYLALTPVDRVSFDGTVYRLNTHMLNSDNRVQIQGDMFVQNNVVDDVDISTVQIFSGRVVTKASKADPYRPTILFTNAINDSDAERSFAGKQVVYVGIEAPDEDINASRVSFRTIAQYGVESSPQYTSQEITKSLKVGKIVTPPNSRTNIFTTDPSDTLVVKFRRASSIASFQNFDAPYYDVLELPTTNLLIVGSEYIQFGSFEVAGDGLTVTFKNLFRGRLGTEGYAPDHVVDERVYVYDPDTLVTMTVDSRYTNLRNSGSVWIQSQLPAGVPLIDFGVITDAGASRPYAPTYVQTFAEAGDPNHFALQWRHRRSLNVDLLANGSELPNDWRITKFVVYNQDEPFTVADFENFWIVHQPTTEEFVEDIPLDQIWDGLFSQAPPYGQWVAIAQCALDAEGSTNYIVGHPLVFWLPGGNLGTYPEHDPP